MTAEFGTGLTYIHNQAINGDDLIDFLKKLRQHYPNRLLALFMDNLAVHRRLDVKTYYEKFNIAPVWNVAYSPEFNPIGKSFATTLNS
jgi:transposase